MTTHIFVQHLGIQEEQAECSQYDH